jgi:hypothetical protein
MKTRLIKFYTDIAIAFFIGIAVTLLSCAVIICLSGCENPIITTPTDSPTPTFTATNTPVNTATPTDSPTATYTATSTPTDSPTATNTPTDSPTPTMTNTPTNTSTPTNTATNTPTNTPTNSPTSTNTPTNSPTPTPWTVSVIANYTFDGLAGYTYADDSGFVMPAGQHRMLLVFSFAKKTTSGSPTVSSVTYGGVTMQSIGGGFSEIGGTDGSTYIYVKVSFLLESDIELATSNAIHVTWTSVTTASSYLVVALEGTTTIEMAATPYGTYSTSISTLSPVTAGDVRSMMFFASAINRMPPSSYTTTGATTTFTTFNVPASNFSAMVGYRVGTAGSVAPSVTHTGSAAQGIIGFSVNNF